MDGGHVHMIVFLGGGCGWQSRSLCRYGAWASSILHNLHALFPLLALIRLKRRALFVVTSTILACNPLFLNGKYAIITSLLAVRIGKCSDTISQLASCSDEPRFGMSRARRWTTSEYIQKWIIYVGGQVEIGMTTVQLVKIRLGSSSYVTEWRVLATSSLWGQVVLASHVQEQSSNPIFISLRWLLGSFISLLCVGR